MPKFLDSSPARGYARQVTANGIQQPNDFSLSLSPEPGRDAWICPEADLPDRLFEPIRQNYRDMKRALAIKPAFTSNVRRIGGLGP